MPSKKSKPKKIEPVGMCQFHEEAIRELQEQHLEVHSTLKEINDGMRWIRQGVSVNGARGLESVMRDLYQRSVDNAQGIGELKELTHGLRVNRQVRMAVEAWMGAHPGMAKLVNTGAKRLGWMILAAIAAYFGIEGLS